MRGYQLTPHTTSDLPGYSGFNVTLISEPEARPDDPVHLRASALTNSASIEYVTLSAPYAGETTLRLGPDRIIIRAADGEVIQFFTLGSTLTIQPQNHSVHCTVDSEAPIFHLESFGDIQTLLALAIEDLLIEQAAAMSGTDVRLANQSATDLFAAGIIGLHERSDDISYLGDLEGAFNRTVADINSVLSESQVGPLPSLSELL